ncbi:MAG: hypothetical protein KIT84_21135 [Labilithrix sp.]|nr:hypothetical protein [Labilithrix sp.]MCW5813547.1 hypothetical protein [Labilithrix sp.]
MRSLALGFGVGAFLLASGAGANPDISGYSGKPYDGVADTCTTNCHAGASPAPTLTITAPESIKAGESGEITIVVNGTRTATALNAALTTGAVATAGQNTVVPFPDEQPSEVASGRAVNGANGTYKFTFVPPNRNGNITLYVSAMSTNLDRNRNNDGVKSETRTIMVTDAKEEPAPTDGGASSSSSSSSSSGGVSTKPSDAGRGGDDDDDDDATPAPAEEGCGVTPSGGLDAGAALLALGVAAVLVSARRRR